MKYLVLVIEAALIIGVFAGINRLGLLIFGTAHAGWFTAPSDAYLWYFCGMVVGAIVLGGTIHRQPD